MSERDDFDIAKDALQHYSSKLQELKKDDDVKQGNGMIIADIEANSKKALEIIQHLDLKSSNTFKDYTEIICSAFTLYQRDLESSKMELLEKLGKGIHFKWDKIDDELRKVGAIKRSIGCKND